MKKIRVLHLVPGLDAGGISVLLLNYYKNMDRTKIQFDFAIFFDNIGMTGKEFEKMGSKIYHLPPKSKDFKGYVKGLQKILKEGKYDIVHAHQNYMSYIPLYIAKKCGVKCLIAHSHTTFCGSNLKEKVNCFIGKKLNKLVATDLFSCGKKAAEFMYGKKALKSKKVYILNNAIDAKKYKYNEAIRNKIRKSLGMEECYIVGTVGRLSAEKNQLYAIELFKDIVKENKMFRFVIAGNGELESKINEKVNELNLQEYVKLLGRCTNVNELLQGLDLFILPSLHEGLPVTGVEAIASGLPCIFSETISKELRLRKNIEFISLHDKEKWKEAILKYNSFNRKEDSIDIIKKNGLDIKSNAKVLEEKYEGIMVERYGNKKNK